MCTVCASKSALPKCGAGKHQCRVPAPKQCQQLTVHSGPLHCIGIGCSSASSHFAARNKSRADNWRSSQQQRLGGKRGRGKEFKGCYELCVYWKGADIYCRLDKTRIIWPDLGIRQFELGSRRVSMRSGSKTRQAQLAYFIPLRTQEDRTDRNRQISLFVGQHVDTSKIYCPGTWVPSARAQSTYAQSV